jgi:hypothetical protein
MVSLLVSRLISYLALYRHAVQERNTGILGRSVGSILGRIEPAAEKHPRKVLKII